MLKTSENVSLENHGSDAPSGVCIRRRPGCSQVMDYVDSEKRGGARQEEETESKMTTEKSHFLPKSDEASFDAAGQVADNDILPGLNHRRKAHLHMSIQGEGV